MKVILVILIVFGVVAGLLLTLRSSRNTGIPGEDVIKRAEERARAEDAADKKDR